MNSLSLNEQMGYRLAQYIILKKFKDISNAIDICKLNSIH